MERDGIAMHPITHGHCCHQRIATRRRLYRPIDSYTSFADLATDLGIYVPRVRVDKWRLVYPNAGELDGFPHFGTVLILCTDGTEAFFHVGRDTVFHGHLRSFNGPIAKHFVWPEDWDYERRKHRVNVFRRADGTVAIIPTDKDKTEYWEKHSKLSEEESRVYHSIADSIWFTSKDFWMSRPGIEHRVRLLTSDDPLAHVVAHSSTPDVRILPYGVELCTKFDASVEAARAATLKAVAERPKVESKLAKLKKELLASL